MEIAMRVGKGVLRFLIEDREPEAEVVVVHTNYAGAETPLGTAVFKEVRNFVKALGAL